MKRLLISAVCVAGLVPGVAQADDKTYVKNDPIAIADGTTTSSTITVAGVTGRVTQIEVRLSKLTHSRVQDLDVMLVSPDGDGVVLMSDACTGPAANKFLTLTSTANTEIGEQAVGCENFGRHRPNNYGGFTLDFWQGAPAGSLRDNLDDFMGETPNGAWTLLVADDETGETGALGSGWSLQLITAPVSNHLPRSAGDGRAEHYPLTERFQPEPGQVVADVNVDFEGLHHQDGTDLDVLLTGPNGTGVMLMSDTCSIGATRALDIVVDNESPFPFPSLTCQSGVYPPYDDDPGDSLPEPAPPAPYATDLSAFYGTDPAGEWRFFVNDDTLAEANGFMSGDFELAVIKRPASAVRFTDVAIEVTEGSEGVLTLRRANEQFPLGPATVRVKSAAGDDLAPVDTVVEFTRGQETAEVPVRALADDVAEGAEAYEVTLSDPTDDALVGAAATATVTIPAQAGGGDAGDRTAPIVSKVKVKRRAVRFAITEAATVKLRVKRRGGKAKRRTRSVQAGTQKVRMRLRRGRYRVVLVATDAAGNKTTTTKRARVKR